jgi:hypothetical protein
MTDALGKIYDDRAEEWLELREDGWTFAAIAQRAGVSATTVKNGVGQELLYLQNPDASRMRIRTAKKYLKLESFAMRLMSEGAMMSDEGIQSNRDIRGAEILLKVLDAKRTMYGLDSPARVEHDVNVYAGLSREQMMGKVAEAGVTIPVQGEPRIAGGDGNSSASEADELGN